MINNKILDLMNESEKNISSELKKIDDIVFFNSRKVIESFL